MAAPKPMDRSHMSRGVLPPDTHSKPNQQPGGVHRVAKEEQQLDAAAQGVPERADRGNGAGGAASAAGTAGENRFNVPGFQALGELPDCRVLVDILHRAGGRAVSFLMRAQ